VGVYRNGIIYYISAYLHIRTCARMPFAHTRGIHFCIRTYFHTFAQIHIWCTSTRLGVLSNSADGRRACAFGVCACVRGKSAAAATNTAKNGEREREKRDVKNNRKSIIHKRDVCIHILSCNFIIYCTPNPL